MAARKKKPLKQKRNGGPRPGSGRKPVEAHFALLNQRLNTIEDALSTILHIVMPDAPTKIQSLDPRQEVLPLVSAPVAASEDTNTQNASA